MEKMQFTGMFVQMNNPVDLRSFEPDTLDEAMGLSGLAGKCLPVTGMVQDSYTVEGAYGHLIDVPRDGQLLYLN